MNISKKIMIPLGISVVSVAALGSMAFAKVDNGHTLADMIAQKFNLNKADVQKVIDDHRTQSQADREQAYEDRLTQAVKDGKLTSDQRDKIIAKHKDLIAQMQANAGTLKNDTPAQRKAAMDQQRADITKWEQDNNIPPGYLGMGGFGGPGGRHRGGFGGPGPDDSPSTTPAPSTSSN